MKLHFHPASSASRPVVFFCAESNISYEPVVVDLTTGAHHKESFLALNPSAMVPVLEDGDLILSESSAILKYLADKHDSAAYPKDLKKRARVNERMDWFNTSFYRDFGYTMVYPQLFPHHTRTPEAVQTATVTWGRDKAEHWLGILDKSLIGNHKYVAGDELTIADFFGSQLIATGDLIGVQLGRFPNVDRWMKSMRAMPTWSKVNEATDGFAASLKGKTFITIA